MTQTRAGGRLPPVLAAGILAASSLMVEGAADNWGSMLARDAGHAPLAAAALAPAAANCGMMLGRLVGDAAVSRLGIPAVLTTAVAVAAVGQCVAGLTISAAATIAGYALLGAGCAPVVPIAYAAAGGAPGTRPARAIARVTTMGYAGQAAGPAIVGLAAGSLSLPAALGLPVTLLAGAAVIAAPALAGSQPGSKNPALSPRTPPGPLARALRRVPGHRAPPSPAAPGEQPPR